MTISIHSYKRAGLVLAIALFVIVVSAYTVFLSGKNKARESLRTMSPMAQLEQILPAHSSFAVTFNGMGAQGALFSDIQKRLDPDGKTLDELLNSIFTDAIELIEPIKTILGQNPQFAIGMNMPIGNETDARPEIVLALINRGGRTSYGVFADRLKSQFNYHEQVVSGRDMLVKGLKDQNNDAGANRGSATNRGPAKENNYAWADKDAVIIVVTSATPQDAIARIGSNTTDGMGGVEAYKQLKLDLNAKDNLVFSYIADNGLYQAVSSIQRERLSDYQSTATPFKLMPSLPMGVSIEDVLNKGLADAAAAVGFTVIAKQDGLVFRGAVTTSKQGQDKRESTPSSPSLFTPKLISKVPLDQSLVFVETHDIKTTIEQIWDNAVASLEDRSMKDDPMMSLFAGLISQLELMRAETIKYTGLDIWDDVIAWMTEGAACVIGINNAIPDVTFIIEAGHAEVAANKLISTLELFSTLGQSQVPGLRVGKFNAAGGEFTEITLDPGASELGALGFPRISLSFGFTKDKTIIISTSKSLIESYGSERLLSGETRADKFLAYIPDKVSVLAYADPADIGLYINSVWKLQGDDSVLGDAIINMLSKIKSIILAGAGDDTKEELYGFISIP